MNLAHPALRGHEIHDSEALEHAFWSTGITDREGELDQQGRWVEWRHHRPMDGRLDDVEGRWEPVVSRRDPNGCAYSINHLPRDWRGPRASAYLEREGEVEIVADGWPTDELVFVICVSLEIAQAVLDVLGRWMDPANTTEDVLRHMALETPIEVYAYDYPTPRLVALRKRWWWRRLTAPFRRRPTSAPRA